jgi:ribosomal protein S21
MIIINCENRKLETCLKKYRQKLDRIGQMDELRKRKTFDKPSQKKRRVKLVAKYLLKMNGNPKV